ncbi:ABC transporter ATP-binding protein [Pseudokineococcus sp. 1T1Z-3]|uniref:ABC transporter ATP-binding protein n=1 Tax=Pseudokineococcus sp. 1T1Z-3 TaxID=3132745 RepID=UPI0030A3016E
MSGPGEVDGAGAALGARGLSVQLGRALAVDAVDLEVTRGAVTAVVGPNGSGKSTLLRALGRLVAPTAGTVVLDGADVARLRSKQLAQRLGVLPQGPVAPEGLTVVDLVSRGRDPHRRWYDQWSRADEAVVLDVLARTGMLDLAHAAVDDLSGGQRQRAWIAMALAQQTPVLLLDEPTTYLDVAHQLDVLELVRRLHEEAGTTVLMVLHDLSMAARFADRVVALRDGRVVAHGTPAEVVTPETLRAVFDLEAHVVADPTTGRPHVMPVGRASTGPDGRRGGGAQDDVTATGTRRATS